MCFTIMERYSPPVKLERSHTKEELFSFSIYRNRLETLMSILVQLTAILQQVLQRNALWPSRTGFPLLQGGVLKLARASQLWTELVFLRFFWLVFRVGAASGCKATRRLSKLGIPLRTVGCNRCVATLRACKC